MPAYHKATFLCLNFLLFANYVSPILFVDVTVHEMLECINNSCKFIERPIVMDSYNYFQDFIQDLLSTGGNHS